MTTVLVLAAHPDDEVLGMGGTIARHAGAGDRVRIVCVTDGSSSQYPDDAAMRAQKDAEAVAAARRASSSFCSRSAESSGYCVELPSVTQTTRTSSPRSE